MYEWEILSEDLEKDKAIKNNNNMYYSFSCNWDTTVIFTTVVTLLITVVVIFLSFKTYETYRRRGKNFMAIIAITAVWILPIAGIVSFMYMPTSVTVDDRNLILRQIKGNITIPISEIVEVRQIYYEIGRASCRERV